jgi:hypothetical protein
VVVVTGLELIVAGLAAGAAAGISDTTSTAIRDCYVRLRELLGRRLAGGGASAVLSLDTGQTDPGVWRARLAAELAAAGADVDGRILASAGELLALLDPAGTRAGKYIVDLHGARGVQVGDHNIQTNTFS